MTNSLWLTKLSWHAASQHSVPRHIWGDQGRPASDSPPRAQCTFLHLHWRGFSCWMAQ